MQLTEELNSHYSKTKTEIKQRLAKFKNVKKEDYFYELCFCICTPQSKAKNALLVQNQLTHLDFKNNDVDITKILRIPENYIRFHNQKTKRLLEIKENWKTIESTLNSNLNNYQKRDWLAENVKGIGYKEAGHFLRNIGYENLAILDRHILRLLVECKVYKEIPKISSKKLYHHVENDFLKFSNKVQIPIDELDLLFWSFIAGEIIK